MEIIALFVGRMRGLHGLVVKSVIIPSLAYATGIAELQFEVVK